MSMKPITDSAEVAVEFPEKTYIGSFGRHAAFDAAAEREGILLKLKHGGNEKRAVEMHLHWYLFADVLNEIAATLERSPALLDAAHRDPLAAAAGRIAKATRGGA